MNTPYFEWLIKLINGPTRGGLDYSKVLYQLYSTPFFFVDPMDHNREMDGLHLRSQFDGTDIFPDHCSILEMMIGVAQHCETVAWDGNEYRIDRWFWNMFNNLELGNMDDAHYDPYYTEYVTCRLISRDYGPNGEGGLFYVENAPSDMRTVQIWYQMCWYLDTIIQ